MYGGSSQVSFTVHHCQSLVPSHSFLEILFWKQLIFRLEQSLSSLCAGWLRCLFSNFLKWMGCLGKGLLGFLRNKIKPCLKRHLLGLQMGVRLGACVYMKVSDTHLR